MYCTNCGKLVNDNAKVCLNCGVDISDGNRFCPSCGAEHDPKASICLKCGVSLKSEEKNDEGDFVRYTKRGIKNAFKFSGRMSRAEFWWFYLAVAIAMVIYNAISGILSFFYVGLLMLLLDIPLLILVFIILGAAVIRRLHDIGKSGWYSLLYFLAPLTCGISAIVSIVYACQPGDQFENEYGPVPQK